MSRRFIFAHPESNEAAPAKGTRPSTFVRAFGIEVLPMENSVPVNRDSTAIASI
jgi:hypothetical protein